MTRRLYTIPLPERSGDVTSDQIRQQLAQQGLLQQDTRAVEQIALGDSTHRISGRLDWGPLLSARVGSELQSLGESSFGAVPLFGDDADIAEPGYYQVDQSETGPVFEGFDEVWSYDTTLTKVGTQETEWRAVRTNPQDAANPFDAGGEPLLGIDAQATKTRWFTQSGGVEAASAVDTVETEYGDVDLFDPSQSSLTEPTLLFELAFGREGRTDVTVWDDRDRDKTVFYPEVSYGTDYGSDYGGGTTSTAQTEVTVWQHVFHTGWQRTGEFVLENGRFRLRFNESEGLLEPERWSAADGWTNVPLDQREWVLQDATPERINAVDAEFYVEFTDGTDLQPLYLSLQRGASDLLVREPENVTTPQTLLDVLDKIALDWTTDLAPSQATESRSEVEDV